MRTIAIVETAHAARYMGQLVKHFAHKLPTSLEAGSSGRVEFPIGTLEAGAGDGLTLTATAEPKNMTQLQGVIARHLLRFTFREPELTVSWAQA